MVRWGKGIAVKAIPTLVFLDKHVPPNALTGATIAKSKRLPVCTSER